MSGFDFQSPADLFATRHRRFRSQWRGYQHFTDAAEAIRYAMEELPPALLPSANIEVNDERLDCRGIRRLYEPITGSTVSQTLSMKK